MQLLVCLNFKLNEMYLNGIIIRSHVHYSQNQMEILNRIIESGNVVIQS